MSDDVNVVGFPKVEVLPEEMVRRQRLEAERLARLSPGEWQLGRQERCSAWHTARPA